MAKRQYGTVIVNTQLGRYWAKPGRGTVDHKSEAHVFESKEAAVSAVTDAIGRKPTRALLKSYKFVAVPLVDPRNAVARKLHTGILTADPNKSELRPATPADEAAMDAELALAPVASLSEHPFMRPGKSDTVKKETNPKDQVGVKKVPVHVVPPQVIAETGLALLEGARKYGSYNYRVAGVRASVYYDAVMARHMPQWWEGEDIDPDSGISHITKAIASLVVLRDAMMNDKWVDDRPPKVKNKNWVRDMNAKAAEIIDRYPNCTPPYTELGTHTERK